MTDTQLTLNSEDPVRADAVPNKGPIASEEEALSSVVQRLVENLDPIEIWLFGSRAQGTHRPDSDFDLFVVTAPP